jgi:hypothetical protein
MNGERALLCLLAFLGSVAHDARAEPGAKASGAALILFADRDDDDDNGVRDAEETRFSIASATDIAWLDGPIPPVSALRAAPLRLISGTESRNVARRGKFGLQGQAAGTAELDWAGKRRRIHVVEVVALDWKGERVDLVSSHAAISRQLPSFLGSGDPQGVDADPDALRWLLIGPAEALPEVVALESRRPDGSRLDGLEGVRLSTIACPAGVPKELSCSTTATIRATGDRIDRIHPESAPRSLQGEVGGRIALLVDGRKASSIRVGGPRHTAYGAIARLRGRLRMHVLRAAPRGMPALGGDEAGALSLARAEVETASGIWGQCGIHFGDPRDTEIFVRDPPPAQLIAVGCELGLRASGGEVRFKVGEERFRVPTRAGMSPAEVAVSVAQALSARGLGAGVSPNPKTGLSAEPTVDVLVRTHSGGLAAIEHDGTAPLSSDPTLGVCLGEVDLADGLEHFTDADSAAGTLEERTLIKAYADGDPTTIDVFIVPAFSGAGRIGESFVDAAGASIQNVVVLDRAGIRAGARSYALAHELGHILLDMAGHPDDYGVDLPSALMDADATDPSIFGPRRLSVAECERALRQSGDGANVPLLTPWPMTRR